MNVKRRAVGAAVLLASMALFACECETQNLHVSLAELAVVPDPVEFGEVPVSTARTIDVTLTNRGTGTISLRGLSIADNDLDFSLSLPDGLVFPHSIPPGNQVVFTVRYHPQVYPEQDEGAVLIESNDKDAPEYLLLLGGTAVEPILLVEPVPVDFGATRVLGTKPATVQITHTGSSPDPVQVTQLEITDSGGGDFAIQQGPDVPLTMNPGDHININLSYIPQLIDDADEGILTIESDAESQEHMEVPLLGNSFAPHIVVSTSALNFGTVSQGANPTLSFTISNDGNADLNIAEMALSEFASQKFEFNPGSIDSPIAPLDSVAVQVTYIADDRGDDDGRLAITHDDPLEHPVFIALHGRTPAPDVELEPEFITINLGGDAQSMSQDVRIYNLGDEDLRVISMSFENPDGTFSISAQPTYPAIVEPGAKPAGPYATVTVLFEPAAATVDDQCTLTFTTDDPDEETVQVIITGTYSP